MQEQNFENQVRNKMDELSFVPSAPVWEKVEEQIRKKNEKRRFLLLLLPLFIITTGTALWLITRKDSSTINNNEVVSHQKVPGRQPDGNNLNNNHHSSELNIDKQEKVYNTTESGIAFKGPKDNSSVIPKITKERTKRNISSETSYSSENPVVAPTYDQPESFIKRPDEIAAQPVIEPSIITFNRDSILNSRSLSDMHIPHVVRKQDVKQTAKNNKWQLAFTAQAGISGISNGIGIFAKSADMVFFDSSPNLSNANFASGGFSNAAPPPTPSVPESGFAFSAGLDVKRKINDRFGVLTGLRYAYYSTSMQVGSNVKRDTSFIRTDASLLLAESYYRNDAHQDKYTNRYHFIQIPLALEYKLIKKIPMYVQGGVKFEKLLSSNALFYNKYAGVYIKDKEMLVGTGLHIFTGFTYHFRSTKAFSFALGPQLQYGITSLTMKNSSTQQHLYMVGLSTQFFFKKK